MLQRGDSVPHFEVTTLSGEPFSYSAIWQRRNLVFVAVPDPDSVSARHYVHELAARAGEIDGHNARSVVTSERVAGMPAPGVVIADKWGEIIHLVGKTDAGSWPPVDDLIDWVKYVEMRCPECEGEAR